MRFAAAVARHIAAGAALLGAVFPAGAGQAAAQSAFQPETSDVKTLDPPKPGWFFYGGGFILPGTWIYDSGTAKMVGMIETPVLSDLAIDPAGKFYYVAQTVWTKGWRGTRQDMVTVYDSAGLKVQSDIPIPGRILVGARKNNFIVSDDGKTGYVYNFSPASSVNVIDLAKRKFVRAIDLPGCASLIPNPDGGFSALCSDGTIATVQTGAKPAITHSAAFFSASNDPIFDNFAYDRAKKQAVFLTYTGTIHLMQIGAQPSPSGSFSLQQAAGVRAGATAPLDVNWYPGGFEPMALHRASGQLYVLMHAGEYWSHKAAGTEIWQVDLASRKVVKRVPLAKPARAIEVTQGPEARLIVSPGEGDAQTPVRILDAKTLEEKSSIEEPGGGSLIIVADPA